jgi:hypothetical protein
MSKSETNRNDQNPEFETRVAPGDGVLVIRAFDFEFVSDFGFPASDFGS